VRPLQITDLVAEQPAGRKSMGSAAAPSVNSVGPKTAAGAKEKGSAFSLAISTMNEHLCVLRRHQGPSAHGRSG
jgi:hypothetical protein